jgi:chorismate-pyruvate lyase
MNAPAAGPKLDELLALLPPTDYLKSMIYVAADRVPEPFHSLLVHEHHMTVTVEEHHGSLVDVRVLDSRQNGDSYVRKILLALKKTGTVVQFGLVRIHLQYCSPDVRTEILARRTPLGRILIQHDVMRRIEPTGFLRVVPGPDMMNWFGLKEPTPTYGRLAIIHCDGQPAIELLEVVAPEESA